jgi:hypothetical protein
MPRKFARTPDQLPHDSVFHLALERLARTFEPKKGLEPFRLPSRPFPLGDVVYTFFAEADVDPGEVWYYTPSDSVLSVRWEVSGAGSTSWDLQALTLASRRRIYLVTVEDEGTEVIAATAPTFTPETADARIIDLLTRDNGRAFGCSIVCHLPTSVSFDAEGVDHTQTIVNLFRSAEVFDELREQLRGDKDSDEISLVERWLGVQ